jgi:hypothetical protein
MTTFFNTFFGDIAFDAVITESITASSTVTTNPVEFGAEINDHIYENPKVYNLQAGVSNTPLSPLGGDLFSGGMFGNSGGAGRRASAWEILNFLHELGEPFSVQSGLETIDNMVIVNLEAPNDAARSGSLIFNALLVKIKIVSTEESKISAEQLKGFETKVQAASNQAQGKVTKVPKTDKSIALQIYEAFTGE